MTQDTGLLADQQSNYGFLLQAYNNLAGQLDINDLVASRNAVKRGKDALEIAVPTTQMLSAVTRLNALSRDWRGSDVFHERGDGRRDTGWILHVQLVPTVHINGATIAP